MRSIASRNCYSILIKASSLLSDTNVSLNLWLSSIPTQTGETTSPVFLFLFSNWINLASQLKKMFSIHQYAKYYIPIIRFNRHYNMYNPPTTLLIALFENCAKKEIWHLIYVSVVGVASKFYVTQFFGQSPYTNSHKKENIAHQSHCW